MKSDCDYDCFNCKKPDCTVEKAPTDKEMLENVTELLRNAPVTEAQRQRVAKRALRRSTNQKKPVRCVETGEVYESLGAAARETGISSATIKKHCDCHTTAFNGLHYRFCEVDNDSGGKTGDGAAGDNRKV